MLTVRVRVVVTVVVTVRVTVRARVSRVLVEIGVARESAARAAQLCWGQLHTVITLQLALLGYLT